MTSGPASSRRRRGQARAPPRPRVAVILPRVSLVIAARPHRKPGTLVGWHAVARRIAVGEIVADVDQRRRQTIAVLLRQPGERLLARLVAERAHPGEDRLRLRRQIELACPAVGGVGAALDPARLGHAVDETTEGDRLDLEDFGEARLIDTLMACANVECAPFG